MRPRRPRSACRSRSPERAARSVGRRRGRRLLVRVRLRGRDGLRRVRIGVERNLPHPPPGRADVRGAIKDADGGTTEYTASVAVGVTFDSVCAIAQQFASPKVAKKICDALARAEKQAGKGNRRAELAALVDAAKEVVAGGLRGDLTPAEAATLLRLIAKL